MKINKFVIICIKCSIKANNIDGAVNMNHNPGPNGSLTVQMKCFKCGEEEVLKFKIATKAPKDLKEFKKSIGVHES